MRDFEPAKMKRVPFTGIRRVLEKANKLEAEGRKIVHFEVVSPTSIRPQISRRLPRRRWIRA